MSYSIIYARQFVRTTRGIIPLILSGDNNVWSTTWKGRDRRARDWGIYNQSLLELPDADLLKKVMEWYDGTEQECCKYNGKWMSGADMIRFFKNGCTNAMTIEEICESLPRQSLNCLLSIWVNDENRTHRTSYNKSVRTTEELEQWIDGAHNEAKQENANGAAVYLCIGFREDEPLGLGRKVVTQGPVIAKQRHGYLTEYSETSCTFSMNIADAIVFESVEAAKAMLGSKVERLRFIKAENKQIQLQKTFAIKIVGGCRDGMYVGKKKRGSLSLCYTPDTAHRFLSERDATKYFESSLKGRYPNVVDIAVVNVNVA